MVPFSEAKVGESAYVYREADGSLIYGEFSFVTDLEWWDERDREVKLVRQTWQLVDAVPFTLPDPHALHEGEDD
jgi:hypothetical protein